MIRTILIVICLGVPAWSLIKAIGVAIGVPPISWQAIRVIGISALLTAMFLYGLGLLVTG